MVIDTAALISDGKIDSNCNQIMVYDGSTKLKHWVADNSCNTSQTYIWSLVPSISAGESKVLTLYYGNVSSPNTSNGYETFPVYFDDFNRVSDVWNHPSLGDYLARNSSGASAGSDFFGLDISGGKLNQYSPSGTSYTNYATTTINRPNNNYFSIIKKINFTSIYSSSYRSFMTSLFSYDNYYGFDMRKDGGYDLKYYIGGSSTWLSGKGGYTTGKDYILDYNYVIDSSTGSLSRICLQDCAYNTKVNINPDVGIGDMEIRIGSGIRYTQAHVDYIFYSNNLKSFTQSIGSELPN